jgi:hypothetical protein
MSGSVVGRNRLIASKTLASAEVDALKTGEIAMAGHHFFSRDFFLPAG